MADYIISPRRERRVCGTAADRILCPAKLTEAPLATLAPRVSSPTFAPRVSSPTFAPRKAPEQRKLKSAVGH